MKNLSSFVLWLILGFGLCATPILRAQVVVLSNLGTPTLASAQVKSNQYVAQSFVTSAGTFQLDSVSLRMNSALDVSGNFSVHVVTGDSVPLDDLGSGGFDAVLTGNANPASSSTYLYSASNLILQGNTTYWLLLEVASGAGNYRWFFPNSTAVQTATWTMGSTIATTTDQGANWTLTSIPPFNPYMFSITAIAIPEPSTYAALAGLLALGLVAWRRRLGQSRGSGSRTMSSPVLRLLLALGVSLSAHSLHGQFTFEGTDDFNDGVPALGSGLRWSGVFGSNTGTVAWTETNQRLEFTGSHETASPLFSQYGWNSGADVALFDNTSWTASIELSVPHVPTSGFVQGALIVSLVGGSGRSYGLYLYSGVGETKVTSVYTLSNAPTVIDTDFISDVTDVELRLQWDATARTMNSSYRFSPLDAYTTSATLDVVGTLGFDPTGGFYVNPSARATSGESVASGGLYFDNISVSAIPEPSTYAAFTGLGALGLACWRRRQQAAVAV